MDKFDILESDAIEMSMPLLETIGEVKNINGSNITKKLQRIGTDRLIWTFDDNMLAIEIKGNKGQYSTGFFETIADTKTDEIGNIYKIESDLFLNVYMDMELCHLMRFLPFRTWFDANYHKYKLRHQSKYKTSRDTVGRIIPWIDIELAIGPTNYEKFDLTDDTEWTFKLEKMGLACETTCYPYMIQDGSCYGMGPHFDNSVFEDTYYYGYI